MIKIDLEPKKKKTELGLLRERMKEMRCPQKGCWSKHLWIGVLASGKISPNFICTSCGHRIPVQGK